MESLSVISRWLKKQNVVTFCVSNESSIWCANAFFYFDEQRVAFYLLSDPNSRHGKMIGQISPVAGTVNGQTKTVALIRGLQYSGTIRLVDEAESGPFREPYYRRFPIARVHKSPIWEILVDELKFTDNTLGFGKKLFWFRDPQAAHQAGLDQ